MYTWVVQLQLRSMTRICFDFDIAPRMLVSLQDRLGSDCLVDFILIFRAFQFF